MSGGSLDYAFRRVEDAASEIRRQATAPLHTTFADFLDRVAMAMHDLEWYFSGDCSEEQANESIRKVIDADTEWSITCKRLEEIATQLLDLSKDDAQVQEIARLRAERGNSPHSEFDNLVLFWKGKYEAEHQVAFDRETRICELMYENEGLNDALAKRDLEMANESGSKELKGA